MAGKRIKTSIKDVDRSLEDVWRRLDALELLVAKLIALVGPLP